MAARDESERGSPFVCPFCDYQGPSKVLLDYGSVFVIEPINPVVPGHVLVIPKAHVTDVADDAHVSAEVMRHVAAWIWSTAMDDCNVITSRGAAATQTVPHLHVHVVPRHAGDGLKLPWSES